MTPRVVIALAALSLALGCGGEEQAVETLATPVIVEAAHVGDLEERIEGTGELAAPDRALIAAEVDGRITDVRVDEGVHVGAGSVLLTIDPEAVLGWFTGETCMQLLANAMRVRDAGREGQFADVLYADLVRDPIATVARLYVRLGLTLSAEAESRMRAHLAAKPKGKHGAHRYEFEHTGFDRAAETLAHPFVRRALEIFPGAEIIAIRDPRPAAPAEEAPPADDETE